MNVVILDGRLTKDPEVTVSQKGTKVVRFCIANNMAKDKTNFINCIAFNKTGEIIERYCEKGMLVFLQGEWDVAQGEKDGRKVNYNNLIVQKLSFGQRDPKPQHNTHEEKPETNAGFYDIPDDFEDGIPFA